MHALTLQVYRVDFDAGENRGPHSITVTATGTAQNGETAMLSQFFWFYNSISTQSEQGSALRSDNE